MNAQRTGPNRLRIPARAEGPSGEIGDGMIEIGPDDPRYTQWAEWIDKQNGPRVRTAR